MSTVGWYEVPIWESDAPPTYQDYLDHGVDIGDNVVGTRHTYILAKKNLGFVKCCYYMTTNYYYIIFAINPTLAESPISSDTHYIWGWFTRDDGGYHQSYQYTPRSGASYGRFFQQNTYGDYIFSDNFGQVTPLALNLNIPKYGSLDAAKEALNDGVWKHVEPNYDPYADGGASDTGGGGGSFDGTTEIINEPDSPLVNISNTHFVSLYNPTESQIKSLSNYMWNTLAIENWRKIVADPMDAIISLAVLPIDVPSSGTREIYIGAFSTGIACNVASAQYISFDCGTLLIPQYSNSYLDYAPYTDISIYIPYVGLRSLPCDAIMGKTIGLKYRIDIFSGACVVYLTVNGSVLLQFTGNCAQPIPFTSQSWGTAVTNAISMVASGASMIAMPATAPLAIANMASTAVNGGFKADITKGGGSGGNTGFLGVQKPYVIIQRPVQCIPANQNTFTGYPSYITATFGDLKGYTEVDKIILENINATESELNELENILKGGVYVNEL